MVKWAMMARRAEPGLDRERLVAAAFKQLEEGGLDGLSLRRLAAHLGVQAPALYWHFRDKAELLGVMARGIYADAYAAVPSTGDWREWLIQFGQALRTSMARHRDGAQLCAIARPLPHSNPLEHAEMIAAPLTALGLDRQTALMFQASVISYALGWAMFEANGPMHDFLDHIMPFEDSFQAGLNALIAGFALEV